MDREKTIIRTSFVGIIVNILLVVLKAVFGFIASSIAMITDAVNNFTDALSSIITIVGTKIANKKPDKEHPFGHGRVEYVTSFIIGVVIIVAGVSAIREAIDGFINPVESTYSMWTFIVISVAIVVKIALGIFFRFNGKKVGSDTLKASGLDALLDALLTFSTLVGAVVGYVWHVSIENYLAIAIGLFIIKSGVEVIIDAVKIIIGTKADPSLVKKISQIALSFPEVKGVYDVIMHDYGPNKTIGSIHIEVDDFTNATEIHQLTRLITTKAYMECGVILTVGIYASNTSDVHIAKIRDYLYSLVQQDNDVLQVHGFYVDEKNKSISFDLVFSFDAKDPYAKCDQIKTSLSEKFPEYSYNVILDSDYIGLNS